MPRREDDRLLIGAARFVDDIEPAGVAHATFVRSEHAHALIRSVSLPESGDGLVAALTAKCLGERIRPFATFAPDGARLAAEPHPVLATGEVRYVGQPIALVLARTRALAEDLAEQAQIDYEPLDSVLRPEESSRSMMSWSRSAGDVERAFATATHVVTGSYALPRLHPVPIEARGCVADYDHDRDRLTVWCSAQDTHRPRAQLAHVLGRPPSSIRVVVPDVGGAFGSKGVIASEVAAVAAAAIRLQRAVKWTEDRYESFLSAYQGRGISGELELALADDGRMLALRGRLLADLGAYLLPSTAIPPHTAAMLLTGCYEIDAAEVSIRGVATNKPPTGPYRGAGRPEAAYMLEALIDDAARTTGIDRIELRKRNLIHQFPHSTPLGHVYDSGDYGRCLDQALAIQRSGSSAPTPGRLRGIGVALYVERSGGQWEAAELSVGTDGRVLARSSTSPHGQGHDTTFAQIIASALSLPLEQIVMRFSDSDEVPAGVGTFGSRSVAVGGSAIALAAQRLGERGRELAARFLGVPIDEIAFEGGRFRSERVSIEWRELAGIAHRQERAAGDDGAWSADARFEAPPVFSSGAYAATVEIEKRTGVLHVQEIVAVDDAGVVVNPLLSHGQVIGGTVQGLGECLVEQIRFGESGDPLDLSLMQYHLLSSADIPPIRTSEICTPSPLTPLGAKGIGEAGAIGTLPAVANAVADALGGVRLDPPFTDERLWRALR